MDETLSIVMVLIPALPLAAAVIVAALGPKLLRHNSHWPVVVAIAGSFLGSLVVLQHVRHQPAGYERVVSLWTWGDVPGAYAQPKATGESATEAGSWLRDFRIDVTLRADALTGIMLTMVTLISSLVAIYSVGYMKGDRGYWRFFAYFSLFVFSMTMLVSVSNFLLLFVFWEAVGLCSYLLIGFWYEKPAAAAAGKKAFLVNRVGDFGFMLGVFLLWTTYGTLNYHDTPLPDQAAASQETIAPSAGETSRDTESATSVGVRGVLGAERIKANDYRHGRIGLAICLLLLLGACGKSAQFPLHIWLPDAMEGPTPVSALIHAATMVTAGVYMIARCTPLFMASPDAQLVVAGVGGFTALLAALIALTQFDLKRVLAYSTISQLGYMFLGLGTGTLAGISAGMFHLFTHAFFKALLFLGAGSVMHAMGNVIDMRRFGGLRKLMPFTYWTFLIGCLALSGIFPLSGFWSKDEIVASVHFKAHELNEEYEHQQAMAPPRGPGMESELPASGAGDELAEDDAAPHRSAAQLARAAWIYQWLYLAAVFTAFLTACYTFRAFFMTFYGRQEVPEEAGGHAHESPRVMVWPLVTLAVFAAGVGLIVDQSLTKGTHPFAQLLALTPSLTGVVVDTEALGAFHFSVAATSMLVAVGGLLTAAYLYLGDQREVRWLQSFMDFRALTRGADVEAVAQWGQQPAMRALDSAARRVGLHWPLRLVGEVIRLVVLVISAPLLLGRFVSPYCLSYGKFFIDEIYEAVIVKPLRGFAWLCDAVDQWLVDGLVNLAGRIPLWAGSLMRSMQTGMIQFYALGMLLGGLVLLLAVDQQLAAHLLSYLRGLVGWSVGAAGGNG